MFQLDDLIRATKAKIIKKLDFNLFKGVSTDSRTIKKNEIFFALDGVNFDGHNFIEDAIKKGAKAIVVSKDMGNMKHNISILKVKNTTLALGELAKFYRKKNSIPLLAITGSTGKTTTKDIISDVLASEYKVLSNFGTNNNHIGVPQTIFKINNKHDICVLELGTNHFGEISYLSSIAAPQIAVITNIGASHLESFGDLRGVLNEKKDVLKHLRMPKIVLLNGDDDFLRKIRLSRNFKVFYFGYNNKCDFTASNISVEKDRVSFYFNKKHKFYLNSFGSFNIYNALAAIACGLIFGVRIDNIRNALNNFQFPEKRLTRINCSRFSIIDDTYNSNPLSLRKAIESLVELKNEGRRILIMGDMLELGKRSIELHKEIGKLIANKPIDMLITLGKISKIAARVVQSESKDIKDVFSFDSKPELIYFLKDKIKSGDILLIKGSRALRMEDITSSLVKTK
jgi:UDP-N-acetylmuramoyl-tripeptide--D-alanyl-D-alanine ligase